MLLSRKAAGAFVGVFVIGAAVGALIMWDLNDTELVNFMNKTNDPDTVIVARINQKYVDQYHLTPEELEKIQPLVQKMAQNLSQARRQFGVQIMATLDEYHLKISEQLTPEHRALYDKANEARRKQIGNMLLLDENPSATLSK